MDYFKKVSQNLKNTVHLFTIIAAFSAMIYCFKDFSQEISITLLNKKYIIIYLQVMLSISLIIFIVCVLQPIFSEGALIKIMQYIVVTNRSIYEKNFQFIIPVCFLAGIGVVMVYSYTSIYAANTFDKPEYFLIRQAGYVFIGISCMVTTSHLKYFTFKKMANSLLIILLFLLAALLIGVHLGIPTQKGYSQICSSIRINYYEITKITFVIYFASQLSQQKIKVVSIIPLLLIFILVFFIEGKYGWRILTMLAFSGLLMIFVKHKRQSFLIFFQLLVLILSVVFLILLYQESKTIGGLFGVGIGKGSIKYNSAQLIGPLIIEELGFLGGALIIGLFILYISEGIFISRKAPDTFGCLLSIGLVGVICFQTFQYFLKTLHILSVDSVALPFISYGWPQILTNFLITGIILNISFFSKKKKMKLE